MRILLFLYISFEQFNIEKFKMRPRRTIQNSKLKTQNSPRRPSRNSNLVSRLFSWWALCCSLSSQTAAA